MHLVHVTLELLIVLQDLCSLLITASELASKFIDVSLSHLLVQISVILVEVIKVFTRQLLCISQITSLVIDLSPASEAQVDIEHMPVRCGPNRQTPWKQAQEADVMHGYISQCFIGMSMM